MRNRPRKLTVPYYNLQCREHSKPVSRYVPHIDQVEIVKEKHRAHYRIVSDAGVPRMRRRSSLQELQKFYVGATRG